MNPRWEYCSTATLTDLIQENHFQTHHKLEFQQISPSDEIVVLKENGYVANHLQHRSTAQPRKLLTVVYRSRRRIGPISRARVMYRRNQGTINRCWEVQKCRGRAHSGRRPKRTNAKNVSHFIWIIAQKDDGCGRNCQRRWSDEDPTMR